MSYFSKTSKKLQKTSIPKTPLKWIEVKYPLKGYFTSILQNASDSYSNLTPTSRGL